MSSVSQEESRSISENVRWGKKRAMADGRYSVAYSRFLGYKRGKDGEMVVDEEGAAIVRYIFKMRLQGYSDVAIADRLTSLHVPTPTGGEKWDRSVVKSILCNEKMKGDAMLQKTYKPDFLSKKQKRNRGELEKAYVSSCHQPIIAPALFDEVQGLKGKKNPWSTRMLCGLCGRPFRIKTRHGKACWECMDSYKGDNPCKNMFLYEDERERIVTEMIRQSIGQDVVDALMMITERMVKDKDRMTRIKAALDVALVVSDDEEFILSIKEMRLFPEGQIDVMLVDGTLIHHFKV